MLANIFVAHGPGAPLYIKHGILRWHQPRAGQTVWYGWVIGRHPRGRATSGIWGWGI